jgi:hypothetical protein
MAPTLYAEDDTTTVVAQAATPDDAVKTIALPDKAADKAKESAAAGLETANTARELHGNETAAEARELGREFGERMAEEARANNPSEQLRESAREARRDAALERRPTRPERPSRP